MLKLCLKAAALLLCILAPILLVSGEKEPQNQVQIPQSTTVLLLGKDDASGLADFVALFNLDTEQNSVMLVQIPRDTYISIPNARYKKLNGAAKLLGSENELCALLSESMGIDIDGFVAFDSRFVKEVVDLLGGVELTVPMDMDYEDPYQKLSIHLKKGKQRLNGEQAVGFVRYRKGYLRADIGRGDAQKIFLSALAKTTLERVGKKDVLPLARLALRYVKTDLPIDRLVSLGGSMGKLTPENLCFATMPGEEVKSQESGAWFYLLSRSGCKELLECLGGGEFDKGHIYSDAQRTEFEEIYNKDVKARIYNASEIDGEGIDITPK